MNQILRLIVPLAVLLALSGCGDSSEDDSKARALLRDAFSKSIGSAEVSIDLSADLDGNAQFRQPVRVKVSGPYHSNGNGKLPDADWDVSISGGGQTFSVGLLTTADSAFLQFQGTSYTLGDGIAEAIAGPPGRRGEEPKGLTERLGVDPLDWVRDASIEGDADVGGVATRHVEARVDVGRMLRGLNRVVGRATGRGDAPRLTDKQIDSAREAVEDPRFDAYVGKADGKIRRVSIDLRFEVPEESRRRVGGLEGGTVTLDVELAGVGRPQRVEPPKDARPIAELVKQLGGLGALGALFGGPGGATGPTGPTGTPPTPEQLELYERCVDEAKPDDRAAIDRCAALLR